MTHSSGPLGLTHEQGARVAVQQVRIIVEVQAVRIGTRRRSPTVASSLDHDDVIGHRELDQIKGLLDHLARAFSASGDGGERVLGLFLGLEQQHAAHGLLGQRFDRLQHGLGCVDHA